MSHASLPLLFAAFPFFSSLSLFSFFLSPFSLSLFSLSRSFYTYLCVPLPPTHPHHLRAPVPRPSPHSPPRRPPLRPSGCSASVPPFLPAGRRRARSFARPHSPHLDHLFISHATRARTHRHEYRASTVQLLPPPSGSRALRPAPRRQPLTARPHVHTRSSFERCFLPRAEPLSVQSWLPVSCFLPSPWLKRSVWSRRARDLGHFFFCLSVTCPLPCVRRIASVECASIFHLPA